jgi:hypothetical protein
MASDFELFNEAFQKGSKGRKVRFIQGLLNLQGYPIAIDGAFGPATEYAVKEFQKREKLAVDGMVGRNTFAKLISPMMNAMNDIPANGRSLGEMVAAYAMQHLKEHPREIGGQNMGPWVKLYMNGNEGQAWPWCAGFACFVLRQACKSLNMPLPFKMSFSCDSLAANAKEKGMFLSETKVKAGEQVTPGSFFLQRRTPSDWVHTGIVIKVEDNIFHTIEGNTNDEGSREGYEVCQRIRGYKKKDFILIE